MENAYTDMEWIDRYIDNKLSREQMDYVAKRIAEEPDFKVLYEQYKVILHAIRASHLKEKLTYLKTIESWISAAESAPVDSMDTPLPYLGTGFSTSKLLLVGKHHQPSRFEKIMGPYFIAMLITLMAFTYTFITVKKPPVFMDCIVSIATFNKCL